MTVLVCTAKPDTSSEERGAHILGKVTHSQYIELPHSDNTSCYIFSPTDVILTHEGMVSLSDPNRFDVNLHKSG